MGSGSVAEPGSVQQQYVARERILRTAYEQFARRGIRAVGVDEVIARSGVAKATLYRHFRTKNDLVLAFLERREQLWTVDLVQAQSHLRGRTPEERLLAIFDVFDDWFHSDGFDGCTFINVLLELGPDHPLGEASIRHLDTLRNMVRERAAEAGFIDPEAFARAYHILMKGSIISASEGDLLAAQRAKKMAQALIEDHRPAS
jgi:AcrR family transcriptional regulator